MANIIDSGSLPIGVGEFQQVTYVTNQYIQELVTPTTWLDTIADLQALTTMSDGDNIGVFDPLGNATRSNYSYTYNSTLAASGVTESAPDYDYVLPDTTDPVTGIGVWVKIGELSFIVESDIKTKATLLYDQTNNGTVPAVSDKTSEALLSADYNQSDSKNRWLEPVSDTTLSNNVKTGLTNSYGNTNPSLPNVIGYVSGTNFQKAITNILAGIKNVGSQWYFKYSPIINTFNGGNILASGSNKELVETTITESNLTELIELNNTSLHEHQTSMVIQVVKFDSNLVASGSPIHKVSIPSNINGWTMVGLSGHLYTYGGTTVVSVKSSTTTIGTITFSGKNTNGVLTSLLGYLCSFGTELDVYIDTVGTGSKGLDVILYFKKLQ